MNVLSLFDGMSCGRIALERAGIPVTKYYASEIDKHAMKVSAANYPDIVQLGSVTELKNIDWNNPKIDLLIGGSPCQSFSNAGDGSGFDGKSKLFFEYLRVLQEIRLVNPQVKFLLENVMMRKEWEDIITEHMGVQPIYVNSALVSAQMRKRIYWTNIPNFKMPEDKGILLKDIIDEQEIDETTTYFGGGGFKKYLNQNGISEFISCNGKVVNVTPEKTYLANERRISKTRGLNEKSTCLTCSSISIAGSGGVGLYVNGKHRSISAVECEKLQTVPAGYITNVVSKSKAISILGNGWTVDVIVEFLKGLIHDDFSEDLDF